MYSKFGNILTYQFHILLSKEEILSPQQKKIHTDIPFLRRRTPIKTTAKLESPIESPVKTPTKQMSMFRSQSREDFYKANLQKEIVPPVGYYNCNYDYVKKKTKSIVISKRPKSSSKIPKSPDSFSNYSPPKRVSSISFKKQIPRKNILINPLNENRFIPFDCMPTACSNFKRISTPDLSKKKGRDSFIKEPKYLNSYNPDFKLVSEDLGKVHDFNKYSERKPLFDEKNDLRNYEVNWKSVEKNRFVADLGRTSTKFREDLDN